jgi:N-acetylmuramoyl-L-alanine amidase
MEHRPSRTRIALATCAVSALVLVAVLVPSAPGLAYTHTFADINGNEWYGDAALTLADDGVFYPQADGTFGPYGPVTRADLCVYLARVLKLDLSATSPFTDVGEYTWYAGYIGAMYQAGLVAGTTDTTFSPDLPVSRQQAATLVVRSVEYLAAQQDPSGAASFDLADDEVPAWLAGYRDRPLIAAAHQAGVANANRLGIMKGGLDGWFYPATTLTRAQVAVMLYRAFEQPLTASNAYPVEIPALDAYPTLAKGAQGPLVLLLESRLAALHYPCGTVDTVYDEKTADAVMAFEKVEKLHRDGVADAQVWQHIFTAQIPTPHLAEGGDRAEVDLTRQVLFIIRDGQVAEVVHVSTGKLGTPTGHGKIWLKQVGWQECPVGWMFYPSYFWPSFAIHGSSSVPPYPASHGCVRTPNWIAAHVWEELPMGTSVDVYYSS